MIYWFPIEFSWKARSDGKVAFGVMGSLRCVLVAGCAVVATDSGKEQEAALREGGGSGSQAQGCASGIRGDRVRFAHGLSMESVAGGAFRECQRDPQPLSRVGQGWGVRAPVAGGSGRV